MKKSFTLLELILMIVLLGFLYTSFIPKVKVSKIDDLTNRLVLYLKQTRYQSLINDKFSNSDNLWHKKRWTLKFFRCRETIGGIYYVIYSDKNASGHPGIDDSLKDSLTLKNIYSTNSCTENIKNSKYVLISQNFNIRTVNISCNETSSLGQLSFGSDGKIYSKLSANENDSISYEIINNCKIELSDIFNEKRTIQLESKTGYVYKE
ncbi:type II secretion system protein [Poseidonibacter antarcticus]|uniref:type II secretion system protein n=1 Tax=Poseidonibacter antarcticus TaxID=2478538 RepID=UPI000EF540BD|nr:type II secretion system protein [Poseidonibacter antarcticus]